MFKLSPTAIDHEALRKAMEDLSAGALVVFEGRVRNHSEGMEVVQLEYEAYPALAVSEALKVIDEACRKYDVKDCVCVHRTGTLQLGDTAVWVGVTAAHRDAAFVGARYVIDQIKARVPIWKKEHYANGDSGWVNCAHAHEEVHA